MSSSALKPLVSSDYSLLDLPPLSFDLLVELSVSSSTNGYSIGGFSGFSSGS
jgi:hypothetical protein